MPGVLQTRSGQRTFWIRLNGELVEVRAGTGLAAGTHGCRPWRAGAEPWRRARGDRRRGRRRAWGEAARADAVASASDRCIRDRACRCPARGLWARARTVAGDVST